MQNIDSILTKLLLEEKLTEKEDEFFQQWLQESKNNQTALRQIESYWKHRKSINNEHKLKVWDSIEHEIQPEKIKTDFTKIKFLSIKNYWNVAAIIFIISSIWLTKRYYFSTNESKSIAHVTSTLNVSENAKGEKRTLKLSDGTIIKLNAESRLVFPEVFNDKIREVHLAGEAFFEVAKDASRPFIIHSGNIVTTVKGTSFNIRAYEDEKEIAVSVVTGKVEVEKEQEKFELVSGERVAYDIENEFIHKTTFSLKEIAWREGLLIFERADMQEIIAELEHWYGVSIEVKDKKILSVKDYSAEYRNKSLENVLESMSYAGSFKYSITGKKVLLY